MARILEVVQDVLVTIYTIKDKEEKATKMKQCIEKIEQNKKSAQETFQGALQSQKEYEKKVEGQKKPEEKKQIKNNIKYPILMQIIGFD